MDTNPPDTPAPDASPRPRLNWLLIGGWLLGPGIVALIAALVKAEGLASAAALGGGLIGGIICGTHLARRLGKTRASRLLIGFLSALAFTLLSFGISFAGCMAGFR